jgi:putative peptidoglycan lipid II flippase
VGIPIRIRLVRDARIGQVLALMLPVSVGLGLINIDLLLNSAIGSLVSDAAPRAIDAAFRIYMLPQGVFSVAVATVLFPVLSRLAAQRDLAGLRATTGTGMRQIALLLVPSAAITVALATPIVRLVYQRGEFDAQSTTEVAEALFWFSFSLPFAGINLLLTRTFFSLQRPWLPTGLALVTLVLNAGVSLALYRSMGIGGVVLGTAIASAAMTVLQAIVLRRELGGLEIGRTLKSVGTMLAAAAVLGLISRLVWEGVNEGLGESLPAQVVSVGTALLAGGAAYALLMVRSRLPEVAEIRALVQRRLRPGRGG